MQEYLVEQSMNERWNLLKQGISQHLGRPVTEADAADIRIENQDETRRVYHKEKLIGTITGAWDEQKEPNFTLTYTWTWTPNKNN